MAVFRAKTCTFMLLLVLSAFPFNPRMTCYFNQLIGNSRYENFKLLLGRDSFVFSLQVVIENDEAGLGGYGRPVTSDILASPQNSSAFGLSSCKNFIMNRQSCCLNSKFQSFAGNLNKAYTLTLNNTQYPIVKYVRNLTLGLNNNNCSYTRASGPDSDPTFIGLMSTYNSLVKKIETEERKFINQTMCLVCLGIKDYPNFIFPNLSYPQYPSLSNLMYERSYFVSRVNELTDIMLELEGLHLNMTAMISKLINTIPPSQSSACINLKLQASNVSFLNQKRICADRRSCKKIVVKYFGQLLTPQLLYLIKRMSSNLPMVVSGGSYVISDTPSFGFKGNVTYEPMYSYRYLPNVTTYHDSNEYSGLY